MTQLYVLLRLARLSSIAMFILGVACVGCYGLRLLGIGGSLTDYASDFGFGALASLGVCIVSVVKGAQLAANIDAQKKATTAPQALDPEAATSPTDEAE